MTASETSRAAAKSINSSAGTLRDTILEYIVRCGAIGATCDEIEVHFEMRHQTASARVKELRDAGRIDRTAAVRPTRSGRKAFVYVARSPQSCRPHNNPENYVVRDGIVHCRICGKYIGREPK